ncbi:MAG: SAM-dependent methyltransferase, partial [Bacteroidales bacterium]|nr:SAM-dependent methyltransferase [Bacteroidales bacterium]
MSKGRLLLIPSPLGDNDPLEVIPSPVLDALQSISTFVVEEVRTARRYLSKAGLKGKIGDLEFHQLNEHTTPAE